MAPLPPYFRIYIYVFLSNTHYYLLLYCILASTYIISIYEYIQNAQKYRKKKKKDNFKNIGWNTNVIIIIYSI